MSPTDAPENPPLTRRRLREMRTQGIPIILPGTTEPTPETPAAAEPGAPAEPAVSETDASADTEASEPAVEPDAVDPPVEGVIDETPSGPGDANDAAEDIVDAVVVEDSGEDASGDPSADDEASDAETTDDDEASESGRVIAADFGAELLAGDAVTAAAPPSFDHLLTRSGPATGSVAVPNALILSQTPEAGPLVVQAGGEVIITGSYELPASFGSTGSAPGTADDKTTDAGLIDEEIPLASSPIPVSASAAISTIKSGEEIVAPPVPEKTNRVMMILAITAGVLALGLTGVLILAFATGVFR